MRNLILNAFFPFVLVCFFACEKDLTDSENNNNASKKEDTTCVDKSLIDSTASVTTDWNPVCGCDGKTYSNPEAAKVYGGVKNYTNGTCDSNN